MRDRSNSVAWSEFIARFGPILEAFGRKLGLRPHDAQDAAQDTLLAFALRYREGEYDREKGRLRTWLLGIARHKVCDIQRRQARQRVVQAIGQTGWIENLPDDRTITEVWESQWTEHVLRRSLEIVRSEVQPETMRAFELVALQNLPAAQVAQQLAMSANAVYLAKKRVLSRLRALEQQFEEILETGP